MDAGGGLVAVALDLGMGEGVWGSLGLFLTVFRLRCDCFWCFSGFVLLFLWVCRYFGVVVVCLFRLLVRKQGYYESSNVLLVYNLQRKIACVYHRSAQEQ